MADEKHKSQRSVTRLFGQGVDAGGNVIGAPVEVRAAHVFLHEKRKKSAAGEALEKPRYDAAILVPKLHADPAQCPNYAALSAHCMEAAGKAWGQWPAGGKWPIQDGDRPHEQKLKPGQTPLTAEQIAARNRWRTGSWVIEVTNYNDPGPRVCVLQNGQAVELPAKVIGGVQQYKSGDYGFVSLCAYTFHNKTFGVNFGFEGLLFTRPGEAIGSSGPRSAQAMFGGVAGFSPAPVGAAPLPGPGAPQPQPGYAPPPVVPQVAPPIGTAPVPPMAPAPMAPAPVPPMAPAPLSPAVPAAITMPGGAPPLPPLPTR